MRSLRKTALIIAALFGFAFGRTPAVAQSEPYLGRTQVSGPLACALDLAYRAWIASPPRSGALETSAFTVTLDESSDPYVIAFTPASGDADANDAFSIQRNTCVDASWPAVQNAAGVHLAVGPFTLTGTYVRAIVSANAAHAHEKPAVFDPADAFAYMTSYASGVTVAKVDGKETLIVAYGQDYASGTTVIGCYKEQNYLVDPSTFVVKKTKLGCPG